MNPATRRLAALSVLPWLLLVAAPVLASPPPVIAIIIDDLGNSQSAGQRVAELPGPIGCAVLPHTRFAVKLADLCHARGKEVLLHLPMQALDAAPLGPGGITLHMTRQDIERTVRGDVASLPHVAGVNNHEGSLISLHPGDLAWIMQTLRAIGNLYFVDSYTTAGSLGYQIAREQHVPAARRDVFLDDVDTESAVQAQFERLLAIARRRGFALAIGHPRPATLAVLAAELPQLATQGIELVPVSAIVARQQQHPLPWPQARYPLPRRCPASATNRCSGSSVVRNVPASAKCSAKIVAWMSPACWNR